MGLPLRERYYSFPFVPRPMFELGNKAEQLVPPVGSLPTPLGIRDLFISAHALQRLLPLLIFKSLVNIRKEKIKAIPRAGKCYLPCIKQREGKGKQIFIPVLAFFMWSLQRVNNIQNRTGVFPFVCLFVCNQNFWLGFQNPK